MGEHRHAVQLFTSSQVREASLDSSYVNLSYMLHYCLTKISIRSSVNFPANFVCLWNPVPF